MSQLLAQMLAGDAGAAQMMKQQMKRVNEISEGISEQHSSIAPGGKVRPNSKATQYKEQISKPAPKMLTAPMQGAPVQEAMYDPTLRMHQMDMASAAMVQTPTRKSNLPQAIVESITQNPLNVPAPSGQDAVSLDSLLAMRGLQSAAPVQQMNEVMQAQPVAQPTILSSAPGGSINYEMLQSIVEGVVKKYASALKKQILDEVKIPTGAAAVNEGQLLQVGDGFTVVAKNGDIYRIAFEKQGNINDRPKK